MSTVASEELNSTSNDHQLLILMFHSFVYNKMDMRHESVCRRRSSATDETCSVGPVVSFSVWDSFSIDTNS